MLAVIGIDTIGMRRGLKDEYFNFTDPFIIIAGVVLLDRMNALRFHRLAFPIGFVLIALHVVVGQAEPVKHAFARKGPRASANGGRNICRCCSCRGARKHSSGKTASAVC